MRLYAGGRGAPPAQSPLADLVIGPVVKQYSGKRVVGVSRRLVQGSSTMLRHLLRQTPGCLVLNTAYIERLNGMFWALLAPLARLTHHLVHRKELLSAGMYLVGALYNFCTPHASLTLANGQQRTPAMAAGLTDHCWSVHDLLWQPAKQCGRRSKAMQRLIEQ